LGLDVSIIQIHPKFVKEKGSKFDPGYLLKLVSLIENNTNANVETLIEVGANLGQDSAYLSKKLRIKPDRVYCFEPIEEYAKYIQNTYGFQVEVKAVSDSKEISDFFLPDEPINNLGSASLRFHKMNSKITRKVNAIRLDEWMSYNSLDSIDLLKIDAEGNSFEVLSSLGNFIRNVKIVQLETEVVRIWNQKYVEKDVFDFLGNNSFVLLDYNISSDGIQADSIWAKEDLIERKVYDIKSDRFLSYAEFNLRN
jgi:FkbM family methyltransferase